MDKSNELATNPVSGWNIRGVQPYNALLLQFQYLSSPMQRLEDAHESRHYILTQEQAIELAEAIHRNAKNLPGQESSSESSKH